MADILLNDLFHLSDKEIKNAKISLNITSGKNGKLCIDDWLSNNKSTESGFWPYYGNQCNFKEGMLCLAFYKLSLTGTQYLFVGAGVISRIPRREENKPAEYTTIPELEKYVGRLIIDVYKGNTMGRYNFNLSSFLDQCKVVQILPEPYGLKEFPGYNNLSVNYAELYRAIYINEAWKEALKLKKGVYAIVDKSSVYEYEKRGRIYIGSATSKDEGLYSRWKSYADTLDGGNKELQDIKRIYGEDHIKKNFTWTLLEAFDEDVDDDEIKKRERYWKRAFDSVEHGLNDNY